MMSPNLFYQDFLLCIGVASLIFGLFLLFFKAPANNIYGSPDKSGGKILNFPEKVIPLCHE